MPTQRLNLTATAVASSTGAAVFNFPAPPTDLVWHGTLACTAAPSSATWAATVGGTPWAVWGGASVGGPVQALPGESVQATAAGLSPGITYQLQFLGRSDPLSETVPSYPDTNAGSGPLTQPPGSSLTVSLQGGASRASLTNASATTGLLLATPPAGDNYSLHNATFELGSGATAAKIVGNSTGFVYCESDSSADLFRPLMGQIVVESLNLVTVGGGGSVWLSYDLIAPPSGGGGGGTNVVFQLSHTYAVPGVVVAQTLPAFFVPVIAGQTAVLEAVRCQLQGGTSIQLDLQLNGADIAGLNAVVITPAAATSVPNSPVALSNNDAIQAVLSLPVANPAGLTISVYVQYT